MAIPWGPIISAGSNILGGIAGSIFGDDAADEQAQMQKDQLHHGIEYRVKDAIRAGIHPLYALGANVQSYQPVSVGDSLGPALAAAGQDIGRAVDAAGNPDQRAGRAIVDRLSIEGLQLDNDIKRAQIASMNAKTRAQVGPAFPAQGALLMGGTRINPDPNTSDSQAFESRYGEPAEWIASPGIAWNDLKHNVGNMSFLDMLRWIDDRTKVVPSVRSSGGYVPLDRSVLHR